MDNLGAISIQLFVQVGLLILAVILVGGVLRFILKLAWRLVGGALSIAIFAFVVLYLLGIIRIH
jgi:hypothetical protein